MTTRVHYVTAEAAHAGQRIDNFLIARLKGVPRSLIYRILRTGQVRINMGRVRPDYRLKSGDVIRLPPIRQAEQRPQSSIPARLVESLGKAVCYEDNDLLVMDKPSGLAVHAGSKVSYGLIDVMRQLRPDLADIRLVHRLDKDTSGCLMLAKNRASQNRIQDAMQAGNIDKQYLGLVAGTLPRGTHAVENALRKNVLRKGERMVVTVENGKLAKSEITPLEHYKEASLVKINLLTGRTHQARVHCAHLGHPIAGDRKYGDRTFNRLIRTFGLKRLFLHASMLCLPGTTQGEQDIVAKAPLPPDLRAVLDRLEKAEDG
ncbi:MAG: 23S rRNA pseudouridine(955/2504/2580) synthase RluC [Gammaproteobacteria bacterium]|nr:MAG: 23S rRNA pseudouridine(955/2504/2580) synthase RluC [Gammaproteobacteria bacterium]